jgi:branched-chain amino acid transport system ATP-binding protein
MIQYVTGAHLNVAWFLERRRVPLLLRLNNVTVSYGLVLALKDVSIEVMEKQIVTILGANGGGKSTVLRTISGLVRPKRGTVEFDEQRIDRMEASKIVGLGIAHVPESRGIFSSMNVSENLKMGHYARKHRKKKLIEDYEKVFRYFPVLKDRVAQLGGNLSGGEQQMLAMARAILLNPKLLMIDELSLGLAPIVVRSLFEVLKELAREGLTVLLVEQNAKAALRISNWGYVFETGSVVLADSAVNLSASEKVRKAYLVL